jgi:hypothetical protein
MPEYVSGQGLKAGLARANIIKNKKIRTLS